jgi:hypothetical protein
MRVSNQRPAVAFSMWRLPSASTYANALNQ